MKAIILVLLCATTAHAQSLKTATVTFATAAAADWTTTAMALSASPHIVSLRVHESNPMLQWAHDDPLKTVLAGAAIDAASIYAVRRWIGPRHPKVVAVIFYAQAAARVYFVSKSVRILNLPQEAR